MAGIASVNFVMPEGSVRKTECEIILMAKGLEIYCLVRTITLGKKIGVSECQRRQR